MGCSAFRTLVAASLVILLSAAHAEVIELEGTVKAVDADARTISIERKTAKGTKTLDLEVNKKAGDLSAVKVGDKISFSYDPDLELITKIGEEKDPADKSRLNEICRVTISISEKGECRLRLEKAVSSTGETERVRQPDGTWVAKHYFASPSDIELFNSPFGKVVNARVDKAKKCLLFETAAAKGFVENKVSQINYPGRFRVPFEASVDLSAIGSDFTLVINATPAQIGQRHATVNIASADALQKSARVSVGSISRDAQGKPSFDAPLVEEETISLSQPWEKQFRLPIPNIRNRDAYNLRIGALGESVLCAYCLTVSGIPVPTTGIRLGEKSGVVFAENVAPNSLAEKANIQSGDVICEIRGKTPSSAQEALELIADMPFNEASEVTIQRGDSKKTVQITPTFGK